MPEETAEDGQAITRRGLLAAVGGSAAAGGWWLSGSPSPTEATTPSTPFVPEDIDERAWITGSGFVPAETTAGPGETVELEMQLHNQGGEDGRFERSAYLDRVNEDGYVERFEGDEVAVDVPADSVVETSVTVETPPYLDEFTAVLPDVWFSFDLMGNLTSQIEVTL